MSGHPFEHVPVAITIHAQFGEPAFRLDDGNQDNTFLRIGDLATVILSPESLERLREVLAASAIPHKQAA